MHGHCDMHLHARTQSVHVNARAAHMHASTSAGLIVSTCTRARAHMHYPARTTSTTHTACMRTSRIPHVPHALPLHAPHPYRMHRTTPATRHPPPAPHVCVLTPHLHLRLRLCVRPHLHLHLHTALVAWQAAVAARHESGSLCFITDGIAEPVEALELRHSGRTARVVLKHGIAQVSSRCGPWAPKAESTECVELMWTPEHAAMSLQP